MHLEKQIGLSVDLAGGDDCRKLSGKQLMGFVQTKLLKMMRIDSDGLFFISKGSCSIRNKDD